MTVKCGAAIQLSIRWWCYPICPSNDGYLRRNQCLLPEYAFFCEFACLTDLIRLPKIWFNRKKAKTNSWRAKLGRVNGWGVFEVQDFFSSTTWMLNRHVEILTGAQLKKRTRCHPKKNQYSGSLRTVWSWSICFFVVANDFRIFLND